MVTSTSRFGCPEEEPALKFLRLYFKFTLILHEHGFCFNVYMFALVP